MLNKKINPLGLAVLILFAAVSISFAGNPSADVNTYYAALPAEERPQASADYTVCESVWERMYYPFASMAVYQRSSESAVSTLIMYDRPAFHSGYVTSMPVEMVERSPRERSLTKKIEKPEVEENYLVDITPVITSSTSIGVPPHGYNYYIDKSRNVPIRDFRADFRQTKYYRDEFHNQDSYSKAYNYYNYYKSDDDQ
ncbi:MAG: hypothetical protein IT281_00730 [Ignavibacteria bacterium]|nr:hypothetical protein [Ignavibacteria bacterium]MCC7158043.1 hypothetical protein [Ignavibacteria bacterium]